MQEREETSPCVKYLDTKGTIRYTNYIIEIEATEQGLIKGHSACKEVLTHFFIYTTLEEQQ
jgi:hypothetical protein